MGRLRHFRSPRLRGSVLRGARARCHACAGAQAARSRRAKRTLIRGQASCRTPPGAYPMRALLLKTLAFAAFVLVLAGSTYGAYQYIQPEGLVVRGVTLTAVEPRLTVAPGADVGFGVVVRNTGAEAEEVRLSVSGTGLAPGAPVTLTVPSGERIGAFVSARILDGAAAGPATALVEGVTAGEEPRRGEARIALTVLPEADGLREGEGVVLDFVGRVVGLGIFNTNLPAYAEGPFPKTEFYQPAEGSITVYTGAAGGANAGFWTRILGVRDGEARTIAIPPEEAYGPKRLSESADRRSEVNRTISFPVRETKQTIAAWTEELKAADQGTPDDYAVNDTFTVTEEGNAFRFRVTNKTATEVSYVLAPALGDRYTLPTAPWWERGAEVVEATPTSVVFILTPTTDPGEAFTFFEYWPDASAVESVNETTIVVKHSPAVGLEYQKAGGGFGGAPVAYRVDEVTERRIVSSFESRNPLAGETLLFDIRVRQVLPPTQGQAR